MGVEFSDAAALKASTAMHAVLNYNFYSTVEAFGKFEKKMTGTIVVTNPLPRLH